jgi:hypothetical protein
MSPYVGNGQQTTYLPRGSAVQVFAKDPLAQTPQTSLGWRKLTEHNRQEIPITVTRIEQSQRMSNGSLRKFFIADKKSFTFSWNMLPGSRIYTVDNQWGALDLIEFYGSNEGQSTFKIRLNFAKTGTNQEISGYEEYEVSCTQFSANLVKRGEVPFYDVSMSVEEV